MSGHTLYETVLDQIGDGETLPTIKPPRASAGVVLWRRQQAGIEVFWIKRSEDLAFMGGWHAFPGGGWSNRDVEVAVSGQPQGVDSAPQGAGLPEGVLDGVDLAPIVISGLTVSAVRELFEETGILLGHHQIDDSALRRLRLKLLDGAIDFVQLVEDHGVELDGSRLIYAGRWLTPPFGPIRFDNRFFLLEWSEDQPNQPEVIPGEVELGEWVDPGAAIERWRNGELITAPPILYILETLATEDVDQGLDRLRAPVDANLGPYRRIEFRPGTLLFPQKTPTLPPAATTNAYILGLREAVLVDPGSPYEIEIERLIGAIQALHERGEREVTAIWLTHHHPDHIGGVEVIRERLGLPVCAHRLTADRLGAIGIAVDRYLEDRQIVELDADPSFVVEVLHTPGHARGHLCFFDRRFGSLIAGDLVAGFGTIVVDPPEGDMGDYLSSLERALDLQPATLFPAHGPTIKNATAKLQHYLDHRRWRESLVLTAWHDGVRSAAEIVERVYEDIPRLAKPLAERQVVAHLEHLESEGRLQASPGNGAGV